MNHSQFWQKATDYYDIHHGKYRRAVLTDKELRETVTDYIGDMMTLMGEWYNAQDSQERCGAYAESWQELGKPEGWKGCSLPKGHDGNHRDGDGDDV